MRGGRGLRGGRGVRGGGWQHIIMWDSDRNGNEVLCMSRFLTTRKQKINKETEKKLCVCIKVFPITHKQKIISNPDAKIFGSNKLMVGLKYSSYLKRQFEKVNYTYYQDQ